MEDLTEYAVGKKHPAGRPLYWTTARIEAVADELVDWVDKRDSVIVDDFFLEKKLLPDIADSFCASNKKFRSAYNLAWQVVKGRREKGTLAKKFDNRVYMFTARMYDKRLNEHCLKKLEEEELIKAKAKIKALQSELDTKGEILKYLESQKVIDELTTDTESVHKQIKHTEALELNPSIE